MKTHKATEWFVLALSVGALLAIASTVSSAQGLCSTGVCVLTWHNDNYRTGDNLNESMIMYNTITTDNFGQLCSVQLDGQVYAQPLAVTKAKIGGITYNDVVYIVTQNDTLYAIDGDPNDGNTPCKVLGSVSFLSAAHGLNPANCADIGDKQCDPIKGDPIVPNVGILGTPVINISGSTGTIYLVAETQDSKPPQIPSNFYHWLYAVDIQSLLVTDSVQICKRGCGKYTTSTDFSQNHIQRPGLLFANCGAGCGNYVYVAMSMMDASGYPFANGTVFGYDAVALSTVTPFYFQASNGNRDRNSNGGGIWQGGAGPAFGTDSSGNSWIYIATANGTFDLNTSGSNAGDSFLKLNPYQLTLPATNGYFTPADQFYRSDRTCTPNGATSI
jgi:hypothetical protein